MNHIWKKTAAILLTVLLAVGVSPATGLVGLLAAAETVGGTCGADDDNLTWSLDVDTGALTISGTGDMADFDDEENTPPWAQYNDAITSVTVGSGVTSIGDYAFYFCPALTSATIGDDVEYIGEAAFAISPLQSIFVPRSVEKICENAFACLTLGEDDDIIPTIQSISVDPDNEFYSAQDGILYNKTGKKLIQYPLGKPGSAFTVPDGVTAIGDCAFVLCLLLTEITLPDTVKEIGSAAFEECLALETISLGNGLEIIREDAFVECVSLTEITIPDSVTLIDDEAFGGCLNLRTLTLGSGVEQIGKRAFTECASLERVDIPGSVTVIGSDAFYNCESLETLTIGNGVGNISANAFAFTAITAVAIPDNVTAIGSGAFQGCASLAEVTLGSGLQTISDFAFSGCSSLGSIHIPSGVTTIGTGAFNDCSALAYICSDAANGAAKEYADANGIEFRYCGGGEQPSNTVSGTCGDQGSNVTWTLDLDTGAMTISGTGAMADYELYDFMSCETNVPWAQYRDSILTVTVGSGVTGVGDNAFDGLRKLESAQIGNDVTTIGILAFKVCAHLTSILFGSGVTTIDDGAFLYCSALSSVTLPDSLTTIGEGAFQFCDTLADIMLPKDLTVIGEKAFADSGLTSVSVPAGVQQIGTTAFLTDTMQQIDVDPDNAFYSSENGVLYNKAKTALIQYPASSPSTVFELPDSVTQIGAYAFEGASLLATVVLPGNVTTIGQYAFAGCADLKSINIPNGVKEIANDTFLGCGCLMSITIPGSATAIGQNAFSGCVCLEDVTFGSGVVSIGDRAFSGTALKTVILPDSVESIGLSAFSDCSKLESIHISSGAKTIGENVFDACPNLVYICSDSTDSYAKTYAEANKIEFRLCTGHTSSADTVNGTCGAEGDNLLWALNLGSGEMIISGTGAMEDFASTSDVPWADYRNSILNVTVQTGVTTIGSYAFRGCTPLVSVTIGEDVTEIGRDAFSGTALTSVAIPRNVQTIGEDALDCFTNLGGVVPTLQSITVDPENDVFSAADGVLYDKAQTTLIRYPGAAQRVTFVIPGTVTAIADYAFKNAVNLTSIHIPSSVTQIGTGAFIVCSSLEYICCDVDGSFAQTYAAEYCLPFRLCIGHNGATRIAGDANGDGIVNLKDVVLMRRYLAGGWDVTILAANADVDADNTVTLQDVTLICRCLAGGWNVALI